MPVAALKRLAEYVGAGQVETERYIEYASRKAPWELMHKLINGQPGKAMPAFGVLPRQLLADIIAYSQTLPEK